MLQIPVVDSTDRSKAMVPVLVLLFVALWFILRGDLFYDLLVLFCSCVFFSSFSIPITLLVEERASLGVFRTFVRFGLVWVCLFSLPLGVWEGLRFVIVARLGLFSYFVSDCGTPWTFHLPHPLFLNVSIDSTSRN